ncbi:MAG TPA: hypothetical protein VL137_12130 [Polyangiaceae bacterium]|nr:hypothetical protein [Polyangiaceae bacterium]
MLCNAVADHGGPFTQLSANGLDICGLKIDETLSCWGSTFFSPTMTNATFKSISVGFSHLCAVNPDDSVSCFGDNVPPGLPPGKYSSVAAGMTHDCAVREEGSIVCWGSNDFAEGSPPKQPECAVLHMVHDPVDGHCVCPSDAPDQCAAALCVDLQTDRTHCGTCDTACPIRADCVAGACVCPATAPDLCDGNCVNLPADPRHCGQCGTECPAGASCNAGTCSVGPTQVATLPNCSTPRMTLTNGAFFVTDPPSSTQSVLMVAAATGAVTPLAHASPFSGPIISDAHGVYWIDGDAIMKQPLPIVSKPQVVITLRNPAPGIAVANGSLYFSFGNLYSIPIDGSSVGAGQGDLPGTLLVASDDFGFVSLAINDTHVAYMTGQYGEIASNTLDGNNRVLLAYGQTALIQDLIQITPTHAYWANGSQILRALLDQQDSSEAVASIDGTVTGFTLTDSNLYLGTADGNVLRTTLAPAAPLELLARDQGGATSLLHDGTNLYWLDTTCHIMQRPL